MKEIKLSFPYPSTSRHNLSQDIGTSLSMGLVIPVRVVEVLSGDSHRIGTSFSLISNPLVKPLLQGVNMRYCRFWVPRRIYHLSQRANNANFDVVEAPVRHGVLSDIYVPIANKSGTITQYSNFSQSSLFDYLQLAPMESGFTFIGDTSGINDSPYKIVENVASSVRIFNAEPYVAYLDICRNYFADSANNMCCWAWLNNSFNYLKPYVASLTGLDNYIDRVQNSIGIIRPYELNTVVADPNEFSAFPLLSDSSFIRDVPYDLGDSFGVAFRSHHFGLCVPLNRPDRLSRLFDTRPLVSQNATINPSEISISNLSFLSKVQRFLTRRFFGGSRFTDVMYSVFGQKVPHVDSPVLLDVFDYEIGSELVASTNATETQNPGVLGGFFSAAGRLTTSRGRFKRRYSFNEPGYLIDLVYIMPRLFRCAFVPDFYPVSSGVSNTVSRPMLQANFIPDFNGIGWQQPAFVSYNFAFSLAANNVYNVSNPKAYCCEASWQQYRTLPDVCVGAMNPLRRSSETVASSGVGPLSNTFTLNQPLFIFTDRPIPYNVAYGIPVNSTTFKDDDYRRLLLSRNMFSDFNALNGVFGVNTLTTDNLFCVFRFAHQAKRQVTKRFTLNFA